MKRFRVTFRIATASAWPPYFDRTHVQYEVEAKNSRLAISEATMRMARDKVDADPLIEGGLAVNFERVDVEEVEEKGTVAP